MREEALFLMKTACYSINDNPYAHDKEVLYIAPKQYFGTQLLVKFIGISWESFSKYEPYDTEDESLPWKEKQYLAKDLFDRLGKVQARSDESE